MKSDNINLIIYQKFLYLIDYSNNLLKKYPKSETFGIAQEIKSCLYLSLKLLINAIKAYKNFDKINYLKEFDINLSLLKIFIRLSYKYKYISLQNYNTWNVLITEIGNMLGGWINSCQKK